jgi:hypothetical protein
MIFAAMVMFDGWVEQGRQNSGQFEDSTDKRILYFPYRLTIHQSNYRVEEGNVSRILLC